VCGKRHALAALPLRKTRYPLYRRLGGPPGRSARVRKISPPPGFDPQTVQENLLSQCTPWSICGSWGIAPLVGVQPLSRSQTLCQLPFQDWNLLQLCYCMDFQAFGSLPKHSIFVGFNLFSSLQCSQPHTNYHSPEPDESSPTHSILLKIYNSIFFPSNPGLPTGLNHSNFHTQTLKAFSFPPMHAICLVHLNLLHLITLICTENISWSSSIWNFLQPPLTSSSAHRYFPQDTVCEQPRPVTFPTQVRLIYYWRISSKVVRSSLLICMVGLTEFMENFRQSIWSADWECYKTSGRVPCLQTVTVTKLQAGYVSADWECYKTSGRVSGLQTEIAIKLQAGYLVCRLRLLQNFRQGIWSADWDCY
jgi:hypothetical protein